jgi:hypothetical protein
MDKFVEQVTTTKLCKVIDGDGPDGINMSVLPYTSGDAIHLVIGAQWKDECASSLSKAGLYQLICTLQDIHKAMKD